MIHIRYMEKYDTLFRRLLALAIDILVLSPIVIVLVLVKNDSLSPLYIALLLLVSLIYHLYPIYFLGRFGQTLGKMALKLKVVNTQENSISYFAAFLREVPILLTTILSLVVDIHYILNYGIDEGFQQGVSDNIIVGLIFVWFIADAIVAFSNQKRRALHDFIAGTVVICEDNKSLIN